VGNSCPHPFSPEYWPMGKSPPEWSWPHHEALCFGYLTLCALLIVLSSFLWPVPSWAPNIPPACAPHPIPTTIGLATIQQPHVQYGANRSGLQGVKAEMWAIFALGITNNKCAALSSHIMVCLMEEEYWIRHTRRSSSPMYLRFLTTYSFPWESLSKFLYTCFPFQKPFSFRS
jgi:hypothetical protein